jgi:hypothetical protein
VNALLHSAKTTLAYIEVGPSHRIVSVYQHGIGPGHVTLGSPLTRTEQAGHGVHELKARDLDVLDLSEAPKLPIGHGNRHGNVTGREQIYAQAVRGIVPAYPLPADITAAIGVTPLEA